MNYPADINGPIIIVWALSNSIYSCIGTDFDGNGFLPKSGFTNDRKRTETNVFRSLRLPVMVALVLLEVHAAPDLKLAKTLCIAGVTSFAWGTLVAFGSIKKTYLTISLVGSVMT